MSLFSIAGGYWIGTLCGIPLAEKLSKAAANPFQGLHLGPTAKKAAFIALHLLLAAATIGYYFAIPQLGLPFFATRVLQGVPLFTLIACGNTIEQNSVLRNTQGVKPSEFDEWADATSLTAIYLGAMGAYFVPTIATAAVIGLSRHVYSLITR